MKTRIITGVVSAAALAAVLALGGIVLDIMVLLAMTVATVEMLGTFTQGGKNPTRIVPLACAILHVPAFWLLGSAGCMVVTVLGIIGVMVSMTLRKRPAWEDAVGDFVSLFVQIPFVFLLALFRIEPHRVGLLMVIASFAIALAGDTAAYFVGSFLGRHKMNPALSPKKTWEGAAGGLAGSMIAAVVIGLLADKTPVWHWILLGVVGGVAGQMGDLLASMMKRFNGVKDYGKIFPGHGGVMDRVDSVILCAAVLYAYALIAGLLGA